jgi:hypothetical protein
MSRSLAVVVAVVVALPACTVERHGAPTVGRVELVSSPAGPRSAEPDLRVTGEGAVLMSWLESGDDASVALRFAELRSGVWSPPQTIVRDPALLANWADFPSVMPLGDGALVAHWLARSGTDKYAYEARVATSRDGGRTWSEPVVLHADASPVEHGFVSLWPVRSAVAGAAWLDARAHRTDGAMRLLHREIDGASLGAEQTLDARVCDCCQTAAAMSARGPVVVYRDRSPEEIRDIAIVRLTSTGWSEPTLVHADGWKIDACPVNGPAVAAEGDRVVVAWFTAAGDTARVHVAFSDDAGRTFAPPVRVDDGTPAGRVAVAVDDSSGAFVSWIERIGGDTAEVRVRRVGRDGGLHDPVVVASSTASRASGFPRMVRAGHELVFAWTEPGTPSLVRVARASIERPE